MGGDFDEHGHMIQCMGDDVLRKLNDVFGDKDTAEYKNAKKNNLFGNVENKPGNYNDLITAYNAAGVKVKDLGNWEAYLRLLGTAVSPAQGAQNIYDIAQVRYKALNANEGMSTIVHEPKDGGHVRTLPGSGLDPHVIDSPCPMPQPAAKKY
jgi:hypothetical protein